MSQHNLMTNDVTISYTKQPGRSPTIIFIHGTGSNKSIWSKYIKDLKTNKRIALDLRGHGKSSRGKITLDLMASDIINLIKKEQLKKIILIAQFSFRLS